MKVLWCLVLVMYLPAGCAAPTALVVILSWWFLVILSGVIFGEDSLVFSVEVFVGWVRCPHCPLRSGLLQLPLNHSLLMISAVSPRWLRTAGNTSFTAGHASNPSTTTKSGFTNTR